MFFLFRNPATANEPFDKYFNRASASGVGTAGATGSLTRPSASSSSGVASRYNPGATNSYLRR